MNFKKIITILFLGLLLTSCSSSNKSESTGQFIDSATITTKVKTMMVKEKSLSSINIKVVTYKNNVQLSGFVNSASEKELAEKIAISIDGVESVTNSLIVK